MAPDQLPGTDGLLGQVVRLNVAVDRVLNAIVGAPGSAWPTTSCWAWSGARRTTAARRPRSAAVLGRTTGGMSLTLDRLQAAGLVRRLPDPADRRRVVVEATDEGVALARRVNAELHRWEGSLAAEDGERDELAATLARLTELIEQVPAAELLAG